MFDIGWSELLVIAVVLVVVVGPKDLPAMLRTFGRTTKQLRSMAGDFRRQFDDALREAELGDVKSTVDEMRKLDPRKDIRAAMSPMKAIGDEIRSSLSAATKAEPPKVPSAEAKASAVEPERGAVKASGGGAGGISTDGPLEESASEGTPSWLSQSAMSSRVADAPVTTARAPTPIAAETSNFPKGGSAAAAHVVFSPARSKWSVGEASGNASGARDPSRAKTLDAAVPAKSGDAA